jgi:hypothetical protein
MQPSKLCIFGSCAVVLIGSLGISRGGVSLDSVPDPAHSKSIPPTEAPAGFDNQTNGLVNPRTFDADRAVFEEFETIADGLGPVFNARSCAECHTTPVSGGSSQVSELRAGHYDGQRFTAPPGGSLIHDRALDAVIQASLSGAYEVRAFRLTPSRLHRSNS